MADHEDALALLVLEQQLLSGADVEVLAEHVARLRLDVERAAGEHRGPARAHERARVAGAELHPEAGQRLARGCRLALPAGRQLALVVRLGLVGDGLPVAEEPELLMRHRLAA